MHASDAAFAAPLPHAGPAAKVLCKYACHTPNAHVCVCVCVWLCATRLLPCRVYAILMADLNQACQVNASTACIELGWWFWGNVSRRVAESDRLLLLGKLDMTSMGGVCSVRLLGLHHSLYEHPVKVEITAPSDRSDTPLANKGYQC